MSPTSYQTAPPRDELWSGQRDSDPRHSAWKADALPTELCPHCLSRIFRRRPTLPGRCQPSTIGAGGLNYCVRNGNRCGPSAFTTGKPKGFPIFPYGGGERWIRTTVPIREQIYSLSPLAARPSLHDYLLVFWSRRWDSNPQPADYKSAALPLSYVGEAYVILPFGNRVRQ